MNLRSPLLALTFLASSLGAGVAIADDHKPAHDGEDLNVHNKTGHEVVVFLFADSKVHLDETGGTQFAHLKDGESAIAKAPHCTFSILLVDHDDVWHAEFNDCKSTDLTITKDAGHAKKAKH